MEQSYEYSVDVRWREERKGIVEAEGLPSFEVATPPEFPKGHEGIWSPEQLFVASITSCIMNTFLAIADNSRLEFSRFDANGTGTLSRSNGTHSFSHVTVRVNLEVPDEKTASKAERLVRKAEENCFITQSVKARVDVQCDVTVT